MEEIWILENEEIPVSFNTKGFKFHKGGQGVVGEPEEAYLRLVAVKGEDKIEIRNPSDLRDRVVITSPEEALEFVRLFTGIRTHFLFPDNRYLEASEARNGPGLAEYSKEYGKRLNLQPARVRQQGDDFLIERNLLDKSGMLFRAIERVTRDGDYAVLTTTVIDERSPVIYPLYQ
jgi:hypothetical protein